MYKYELIGTLIGLVRSTIGNEDLITSSTNDLIVTTLYAGKNTDKFDINELINKIENEKRRIIPNCYNCLSSCGRNDNFNFEELNLLPAPLKDLKLNLLSQLETLASKLYQTKKTDQCALNFLYEGLFNIGLDSIDINNLQNLINKYNCT